MNEEKYQNGDIYWNTYSGKFKMFDKDGNEIPYDRLEQTITRLEQENKTNEKQIELDVEHICNLNEQINKLEQENKELKELDKKICEDCEKEIKVYWNALEEIREVIYYCGYKDVVDKVLPKINEVLNLS